MQLQLKLNFIILIILNFLFVSYIYANQDSNQYNNQNDNINIAKTIYKCRDKNNNILFTDNPKLDPKCKKTAKKQDIKPVPSIKPIIKPSIKPSIKRKLLDQQLPDTTLNYNTFNLIFPPANALTRNCPGNLEIKFAIDPSLYPEDNIQVIIKGYRDNQPKHKCTVIIEEGDTIVNITSKNTNITIPNFNTGCYALNGTIIREAQKLNSTGWQKFEFTRRCNYNN